MLKKSFISLFAVFLLCSCASNSINDNVEKEPEKPLTMQDVVGMYGEPNFKVYENGITAYAYRYNVNRVNLLNYLPFVKYLTADDEYENYLYAVFDKDGNLIEFNSDGIIENSIEKK